ncbi:MAG: aminoacyl-tRNA deacylase [Alphaproteobacteria bacterium]|nr:aminoacyl-tRNA deacylase [Alphaproteobacteria bacterium]
MLREKGVAHEVHTYTYVDRGGVAASAAALGRDPHGIVKTLVFEDERAEPLIILMHGDAAVSAKALARATGRKSTAPCAPAVAERHTGYRVGGTSPFGTRKALPVYVEASILELESLLINGGSRGVLVEIVPSVLVDVLGAVPVSVARDA